MHGRRAGTDTGGQLVDNTITTTPGSGLRTMEAWGDGPRGVRPVVPDFDDRWTPFHDVFEAKRTTFDGADFDPQDPSFDVDGAAARIVAAYDRGNDGSIDIAGGEATRSARRGTQSIRELANYADQLGNGDGKATTKEIAAAIRRFDQGWGDGRLSGEERDAFLSTFDERPLPGVEAGSKSKAKPDEKPDDGFDIPFIPDFIEDGILGIFGAKPSKEDPKK